MLCGCLHWCGYNASTVAGEAAAREKRGALLDKHGVCTLYENIASSVSIGHQDHSLPTQHHAHAGAVVVACVEQEAKGVGQQLQGDIPWWTRGEIRRRWGEDGAYA